MPHNRRQHGLTGQSTAKSIAAAAIEADDYTPPPRFLVFPQADAGWVLRDNTAGLDYPFHTKAAAIGGIELRLGGDTFIGSPSTLNVYGELIEAAEVFA